MSQLIKINQIEINYSTRKTNQDILYEVLIVGWWGGGGGEKRNRCIEYSYDEERKEQNKGWKLSVESILSLNYCISQDRNHHICPFVTLLTGLPFG